MPKYVVRLLAIPLAFCLVADPVTAGSLSAVFNGQPTRLSMASNAAVETSAFAAIPVWMLQAHLKSAYATRLEASRFLSWHQAAQLAESVGVFYVMYFIARLTSKSIRLEADYQRERFLQSVFRVVVRDPTHRSVMQLIGLRDQRLYQSHVDAALVLEVPVAIGKLGVNLLAVSVFFLGIGAVFSLFSFFQNVLCVSLIALASGLIVWVRWWGLRRAVDRGIHEATVVRFQGGEEVSWDAWEPGPGRYQIHSKTNPKIIADLNTDGRYDIRGFSPEDDDAPTKDNGDFVMANPKSIKRIQTMSWQERQDFATRKGFDVDRFQDLDYVIQDVAPSLESRQWTKVFFLFLGGVWFLFAALHHAFPAAIVIPSYPVLWFATRVYVLLNLWFGAAHKSGYVYLSQNPGNDWEGRKVLQVTGLRAPLIRGARVIAEVQLNWRDKLWLSVKAMLVHFPVLLLGAAILWAVSLGHLSLEAQIPNAVFLGALLFRLGAWAATALHAWHNKRVRDAKLGRIAMARAA